MSSIKVNQQSVKSVLSMYDTYKQELSSAIDSVRNVKSNRYITGREFGNIYNSLDGVITRLENEKEDIQNLGNGLTDILNAYEMCENQISGQIKSSTMERKEAEKKGFDILNSILSVVPLPGTSKIFNFISDPQMLLQIAGINTNEIMNIFHENIFGENLLDKLEKLKDDFEKKLSNKLIDFSGSYTKKVGKNSVYDTKTKTWTTIDPNDEAAIKEFNEAMNKSKVDTDIILASGSAGGAVSLLHGITEGNWGWGSGSAQATFGKVEGNGQGSINFGSIQGSFGAGVTAFTAEEKIELGGEMLGAYAKSTQTLGKATLNVDGVASIVNEDGKFDPSLYAGVNLEAIAAEIAGEAGVKIAGTDIGVKGSLNVGFGAHANMGYKDGKISLDVGASFGVGGSFSLDIDVSGTVNAVKDRATAIWDGLTGWLGW